MLRRGDIVKFTPSMKYIDDYLAGREMVAPGEIGIVLEVEEPRSIARVRFSFAGVKQGMAPLHWNNATTSWVTGAYEWFPQQFFERLGEVQDEQEA